MKKILSSAHKAVLAYAAWGWPILIIDLALGAADRPQHWANALNTAAFVWVLSSAAWPITLVLSRTRRERAMARLCGLREGDERERVVTGEAARSTLLLSLSLQAVLLVMCLVSVRLSWSPLAPKNKHHGLISVGMGFNSSRHLDPFGVPSESRAEPELRQLGTATASKGSSWELGGFLISPSAFSILALLILIQIAAFKIFSGRRYEGVEA